MKRSLQYQTINLDLSEIAQIEKIAFLAFDRFEDINNEEFLENYDEYLALMPAELRKNLLRFKRMPLDFFLIKGLRIDQQKLEKTPSHWSHKKDEYTCYLQFINFLIATHLGYPYGWKTQQNGSLVADVLPIEGFEELQQGFGSIGGLRFHTEDPFHTARADFFTLMCMRNPTETPTTFFPLDLKQIPDHYKRELFKEQFDITPDASHTELTYSSDLINSGLQESFHEFNQMRKIAILKGDYNDPLIQIDPEIMPTENLSAAALEAFHFICAEIENAREEVVMAPGDVIGLNNHRLAHGRGGFKAKYDGNDRWLERILTLEDIRKTIPYRAHQNSYVIVR